jgi:hypothetical protein
MGHAECESSIRPRAYSQAQQRTPAVASGVLMGWLYEIEHIVSQADQFLLRRRPQR